MREHAHQPQTDHEDLDALEAVTPPSRETRDAMAGWAAEQAGGAGDAPVQAHADAHRAAMSAWASDHGAARAADSVANAADALPHAGAIQASFGRHDISGIRSTTGGAAGEAAQAIGATAFATGTNVGFASPPSLHTAAHEAAHVVQQRQGVVSFKGLGGAGDVHEQHADRVADAVVAGGSAEAILDELAPGTGAPGAVQRWSPPGAEPAGPGADATPGLAKPKGLFERRTTLPGVELVKVSVSAAQLPPDMVTLLGLDPSLEASVSIVVVGDELSVVVTAGAEILVATVDVKQTLELLLGPAGSALAEVADQVPSAATFAASAAGRLSAAGGTRVKVRLWGVDADPSFVVIDLARALTGAWSGHAGGLRPAEAHLQLGKAGRVDVFADDQVKQRAALPPANTAIGDLEVSSPALRRDVLGLDDDNPVHATVYYGDGKLAVAIKPDAAATSGVVAELDVRYLLGRLRALGEKVWELIDKLLARIEAGGRDFLKWASGALSFDLDLPGFKGFFAFDFNISLPRLGGGGGGFSLGDLWPTSWSFELPGMTIGALPKLSLPWLKWPKLGSFPVDLSRITGLLGSLGLPSLPSLPSIDFDVHFKGLDLGLALDLGRLWPDLDWGPSGPSSFGLDLDLSAVLEALMKAGGAIADAARWLWKKLKAGAAAIARWVHLGGDGVVRIFDGEADAATTPMLGFSLLRLLDGAQATDLLPSEVRYHGKDADLELGLAGAVEGSPEAGTEERAHGAAIPRRPASPLLEEEGIALPASAIAAMGLADGAKAYVSVAGKLPDLIVYAEAASGHRDGNEALRMSVDLERLAAAVASKAPALPGRRPRLPVPRFDATMIDGKARVVVELGEAPKEGEQATVPYARAAWGLGKLVGGDLEPDEITLEAPGKGGLTRGPFDEPAGQIGERFSVSAPRVRKDVLGVDDAEGDVWLGVYYADQVLALTATAAQDKHEGLLGKVDVVWLLRQLEKLGRLGEKVLDAIGAAVGRAVDGVKGFAAKLAELAGAITHDMFALAGKLFRLQLAGGGSIGWDFSRLIDGISLDGFDLAGLIPDISGLQFPDLPGFSFDFSSIGLGSLGGNPLDSITLPSLRLGTLFGGVGGIDWGKLPDFSFSAFGLDGLGLGIELDLSFLDGLPGIGELFSGGRKLGFRVDLERLLAPFEKALAWLRSKFSGGKPAKGAGTQIALGGDGVLRLWDDSGAHLGFDLTRLLDGFQPADIVPVEMRFEVTTQANGAANPLATLEYGEAVGPKEKAPDAEDGQVLVQHPGGKAHAKASFPAPAAIREHLGAPKGASIHAELLEAGDDAIIFATVGGTDRGIKVSVDRGAIERVARVIGPKTTADAGGGVEIRWADCAKMGGLVLGFGTRPDRRTKQRDVKAHGHAMWRLSRFFDGLELGDLVPDEAQFAMAEGSLTIGNGIAVHGDPVAELSPLPGWAKDAVKANAAAVHVSGGEKGLRVALVGIPEAGQDDGDAAEGRRGVEVAVEGWFLDEIEHKVADLVEKAGDKVGSVFKRTANAGKRLGKGADNLSDRHLSLSPRPTGLRVEQGKDGQDGHIYATFGWTGLIDAVTKQDLGGLIPTEFRIATSTMSFEAEVLDLEAGKTMPGEAKRIGHMHELFRDVLTGLGLAASDYLELDLGDSPIEAQGDGGHTVQLRGSVYTPKEDPNEEKAPGVALAAAKQATLAVSLEALLAQVYPRGRKFANKKEKGRKAKPKGTSFELGFKDDLVPGGEPDPGIGLKVSSKHTNRKGKTREFTIETGWTARQLVEILMNLDDLMGPDADPDQAVGLLTPDVLSGSYSNDLFTITVANRGEELEHKIPVADVPLLPVFLEAFLDPATIEKSTLQLELPDADTIASSFGSALLGGKRMTMGRASLVVPMPEGDPRRYSATIEISLAFLKKLAKFIPYVGLAIKIIEGVAGILTDPKGTAESLIYTPEALYHVISNAGEIFDKLKGMEAKDFALMLMSSDASTKQLVYAARLKKRLEKAGVKTDGKPGGDLPSEEELAWLNAQDPKAIEHAMQVEKRLQELGIMVEEEAPAPGSKLDSKALDDLQAAVEAGYREFAEAREASGGDPNDPKVKAAAEKFRKRVADHIAAGTKKQAGDISDRPKQPGQDEPEIDHEISSVKELPEPTAEQREEAKSLFSEATAGLDPVRADYLIQKFAFLTTDQLADLLETGQTRITTGVHPMFEDERPFVRALFARRLKAAGIELDKADMDDKVADDANLVARWRNRDATGKPGGKPGEPGESGAGGGKASGEAGKGEGDGGAGMGDGSEVIEDNSSFDDALWGDEDADGGGGAEVEVDESADVDGDGRISADEYREAHQRAQQERAEREAEAREAEEGEGGEHEHEGGGGAGGGTEPAEEPTIDDSRLFHPSLTDATKGVLFDEATGLLSIDPTWLANVKANARARSSKGGVARVLDIQVQDQRDVGAAGQPLYEYGMNLTVEIDVPVEQDGKTTHDITTHSEYTTFYYDPSTKRHDRAEGAGDLIGAFHSVLEVRGGKTVVKGDGVYTGKAYDFRVLGVAPHPIGLLVKCRFTRIPNDWRIKTAEATWTTPTPDMDVEMLVPPLPEPSSE